MLNTIRIILFQRKRQTVNSCFQVAEINIDGLCKDLCTNDYEIILCRNSV